MSSGCLGDLRQLCGEDTATLMVVLPGAAQQGLIGGLLDERMLEGRWPGAPSALVRQLSLNQTPQFALQRYFLALRDGLGKA